MILTELFEAATDDLDAEAEAYKSVQRFTRWVQSWNETTPVKDKMYRHVRDGEVMYFANAQEFGGSEDLYMGFSYKEGRPGGVASMSQGRNREKRMPLYYVLTTMDSDPGDMTDIMFQMSWGTYSHHLVHELTHYFDRVRQKTPTRGVLNQKVPPVSSSDPERYYNSPIEFNAYFQQGVHDILQRIIVGSERWYFRPDFNPKSIRTFDAFKTHYRDSFDRTWRDKLTPQNTRRFEKRLYKLWELIVQKVSDRTLRGQEPVSQQEFEG